VNDDADVNDVTQNDSLIQEHAEVTDEERVEPLLRRSGRTTRPPLWHEDYVTAKGKESSLYPISNYMTYHRLSTK